MPRAYDPQPIKITHDPTNQIQMDIRAILAQKIADLGKAWDNITKFVQQSVKQVVDTLIGTATNPIPELAAWAQSIPVLSDIVKALTGEHGGLADLTAWAQKIPVLGDVVKALTGQNGGLTDLSTWATGLETQAQQAAQSAIADVNAVVGQIAHDAEQVGATLAQTIAGVLGLAQGAQAQTDQNTAAITALSSIAPTNIVTSLAASTDPNDIPAFDRILMIPLAATVSAGDHYHTVNGSQTNNAGAHTHAIGTDAWAYTPADKELLQIFIRSDRAQKVNAVKIDTAVTGWSLGGVSSIIVCLHAYSQPDNAVKLLAQTGDQKNTITTAAQEYVIPLGQSFDVLPGHVLSIGVWQQISLFGATRKLAGIPQVGVKPRTGAPIKSVFGRVTGQNSIPATISLNNVTWNYNAAVWGALTYT